jgi:hypothetical protein
MLQNVDLGKGCRSCLFSRNLYSLNFAKLDFFAVIAFFPERWQDRADQERRHKRHLQPFNEENRKIEDEYRIRLLCSSFLRDGGIK